MWIHGTGYCSEECFDARVKELAEESGKHPKDPKDPKVMLVDLLPMAMKKGGEASND